MVWWALLAYVLVSPAMGLLVGGAIRMRDRGDVQAPAAQAAEPAPCPALVIGRQAMMVEAAG